ncbi:monooxygenase [Rhodobacterales bacterium HKCCE3408]|nr:monooxygenase [Rhodobacterales bacterium HKCCE3408]
MAEYDVIIMGGGPVGLGLAIDLGQRGIRVAVIERYREIQPVPKGQNLTQRTLEHIDAWGCEPEMRAARIVPRGVANGGLVTYGTILSDYSYEWLPREGVQPYYGQRVDRMPQYCTEAVLRARAAEIATIDTFYGWRFEGLSQDAAGVTVDMSEREGNGKRSLTAEWCVGCDGSRSPVRQAAGITQTLSDHDRRMVLLVFRSPELNALLAERYTDRSFYCALAPELEGYWRFLGRVDGDREFFYHAPVSADADAETTDFAAELHRAVGQEFPLEITYVGFWDLRFALADRYRADRVLIAGDACHSHPPYGGYGINTGFEDARNLGWKLAATIAGWGGDGLLDSYEAERHPVFASTAGDFIAKFIEDDRAFLDAYSPDRDADTFAREWAKRNEGASEVFAFEPNYEGSPVIGGDGAPSALGDHRFDARPGHHFAPRAMSSGGTTYEAMDPSGFTIFDFARNGMGEGFLRAAKDGQMPIRLIVDTFEGERRDYGAPVILVRPDGYVAWAGESGDPQAILRAAVGDGSRRAAA